MVDMSEAFEGIMFTLKKMNSNTIDTEDNEESNFINFGYYDRLSIDITQEWYSFRPMGLAKATGYVKHNGKYADMYTIRGVFPGDCDSDRYDGFDYNIWRNIGMKKTNVTEMNSFPYVCMSSVHLSGQFASSCKGLDEMMEYVLSFIKNIAKNRNLDLKESHCAIFPVIGFSDFVILFLTNDLSIPANIIKDIRACKHENKIVISNCYTTCGVYKGYHYGTNDFQTDTKVRLSVRFNLREGISAESFHLLLNQTIYGKLSDEIKDDKYLNAVKNELKNYYITFGNADTLIMPDISIALFLSLINEDSIKNYKNLWKNVSNIRTSIVVSEQLPDDKDEKIKAKIRELNDNQVNETKYNNPAWDEFFKDFEKQLMENEYPVRMSRSLEQIIRNYYNLINTSHGFDVKNSIDGFLDAVFKSIRLCYINKNWDNARKTINTFRDKVGDYIADLIRSDKPFIEGNSLLHPAIGSATKLLFTYTSILNDVADKMPDDGNKIVFLVISGGADRTEAIDLFKYLHKGSYTDEYIRPVLIVVPEKSLYDIKGTLFRLFHECMHYCCERKRELRYSAFMEMLAKTIANALADDFFTSDNLSMYKDQILGFVNEESKITEVSYKLDEIYADSKERAKEQMYNVIIEKIKTDADINKKDFYYEYKLFRRGKEYDDVGILQTDYIASQLYCKENDMHNVLVSIINDCDMAFNNKVIDYLDNTGIDSTYANLTRDTLVYRREEGTDDRAKQLVDIYISLFVGNYGNAEVEKNYYNNYTYNEIAELGYKSMREARADLCAIKLLDLDFADYLLAFIYEEKNIDRAMPVSADNVLRVGSVLKLAYGIESDTYSLRKGEVIERARPIAKAGFAYERAEGTMDEYIDVYMQRIGTLIKQYEKSNNKIISEPLENYLNEVIIEVVKDKDLISDKLDVLGQTNMNDKDSCYEAVKGLFYIWKSLGGTNNNGFAEENK